MHLVKCAVGGRRLMPQAFGVPSSERGRPDAVNGFVFVEGPTDAGAHELVTILIELT